MGNGVYNPQLASSDDDAKCRVKITLSDGSVREYDCRKLKVYGYLDGTINIADENDKLLLGSVNLMPQLQMLHWGLIDAAEAATDILVNAR